MVELLVLTAVLGLATGALFLRKTVPAMISFALMMALLGLFYIGQHQTLLGLFQIFIYTGGIVVLMLFGITLMGVEFPLVRSRPWTAATAMGLFAVLGILFVRGRGMLHASPEASAGPGLFATGYADMVILFALIGASLLYATVKMIAMLKAPVRKEKGEKDV